MKWSLIPIPTNHAKELLQLPQSMLPTQQASRKPPKKRLSVIPAQLDCFQKSDTVKTLDHLSEKTTPAGFQFKRSDDHALFYNLVFDEETKFPKILQSIKIDSDLHVQLQYNGIPVLLPQWVVQGQQAQMVHVSIFENFSSYIGNFAIENDNELLEEITQRQFYKPKGRLPYSAGMIHYALHLRYTSVQAYKQLLDRFPLPSILLLNKIQKGGVDSAKALQILHEQGKISKDCVLMVDEMYLQKATQYHSGEYVGADEDGNLYKESVAFMIVGLKE